MTAPVPVYARAGLRVFAALLVVLTLGLCRWQLHRDDVRNAGREQALKVAELPPLADDDPATATFGWRRVEWHGRFVGDVALLAGAQSKDERGYDVVQAWERPDGSRLLVDRGWVSAADADAMVGTAVPVSLLTGQLRPLRGDATSAALPGHGTRIWSVGEEAAAAAALTPGTSAFVVAGAPDGGPLPGDPARGGFVAVPDRDNTSLHYASQWFAMALLAAIFVVAHPLMGVLRAGGGKTRTPG